MRGNSVVKCGNIRKFKTTFYALFPSKSVCEQSHEGSNPSRCAKMNDPA